MENWRAPKAAALKPLIFYGAAIFDATLVALLDIIL